MDSSTRTAVGFVSAEQRCGGEAALDGGPAHERAGTFHDRQIRSMTGDEIPNSYNEIHLDPSMAPSWFEDLPSVHLIPGVAATVAKTIVSDLARQPLSRYRGRRPLSPIEQLDIPLVALDEAFHRSLVVEDPDGTWLRILHGEQVPCLVEAPVGLFHTPRSIATFSGCPGEVHPQAAVRRAAQEGEPETTEPEVMLLAEADASLGVSVDRLSGPRSAWDRRYVWARRYELTRALTVRFRSEPDTVARLDVPVLAETAWGIDTSAEDPPTGPLSSDTLSPSPSLRVVTGEFTGEKLCADHHTITPALLARALTELGTPFEAVALATRAASPSAALSYARALAELLGVPVIAADGSCHIEHDGTVTAVRREIHGGGSALAMWYATAPGGSVPQRLGRHSLGSALRYL